MNTALVLRRLELPRKGCLLLLGRWDLTYTLGNMSLTPLEHPPLTPPALVRSGDFVPEEPIAQPAQGWAC